MYNAINYGEQLKIVHKYHVQYKRIIITVSISNHRGPPSIFVARVIGAGGQGDYVLAATPGLPVSNKHLAISNVY